MLSFEELRTELGRVTYKPGWRLLLYRHRFGEGIWLSILAEVPDSNNPTRTTVINVRAAVPPIPDAAYFHEWLNYRLDRVDNHERREFYRVDGAKLHDPHAPDANE
jgi:hypothetical protein